MILGEILHRVTEERYRQDAKWGWPRPDHSLERWLAILVEEVGEVAEAILEQNLESPASRRAIVRAELCKELIQVAAVAVAIVQHLEEGYGQ